ncbi:hypothetical protein HG537_0C00480 [Torulaspora globosa]|uniref:Rab-GAP TBC domain-containing protein n=1 Tax=Torulaspora globosa TaxID=48254 RepID=A0A7H9HQ44_9SACH|nr:hypothetical protein HG537_0C00480 [Torulaspora sp. CBS 2947]
MELLFCKSKVFVHPTKSSTDNVGGFLLIYNRKGQSRHDSTLGWIPEGVLDKKQLNWLLHAELKLSSLEKRAMNLDSKILASSSSATWSFSIKLGYLFSIEFRSPSPTGLWYGSVVLHSRTPQEDDTLPVLFFHDDVCPSTKHRKKELSREFNPFTSSGDVYWGGVDFRTAVASLVELKQTFMEPTVWLVNATLDDLRNFSPQLMQKRLDAGEAKPVEGLSLWAKWESARWGIMTKIADATFKTGSLMGTLIRQHPLVKLAERNGDNPYVRKLLENPRVREVQDDFDSARVYLAKWALGVKQQADQYQRTHELSESYRRTLTRELGFDSESDVQFTDEELNKALERKFPVSRQKWESFFDAQGRLALTVNEVKDYIFHGGVEDFATRSEVWLFLLGTYPWDSSFDEREQLNQTLREMYDNNYKSKWLNRSANPDEHEEEYWQDQIFRIEKDVKRNDRNLDIYKYNTHDASAPDVTDEVNQEVDEIRHAGHWEIKNPHLQALKNILVCYNIYNPNLGYVQGMADLLSVVYYIVRDEALSFWCFVNFMERMERNFLRDQSGIRDQMLTLTELCQLMLPQLSEHLNKCDSSNLFFCFRMLLVWFKREFQFPDVCSIWEILLTDFYSSQFQLFFMLAILQRNSQPIMQNLDQFDQVLKYFNDLHDTMDWSDLMTRSELLFIRFKKIMEVMERRREIEVEISDDSGSKATGVQLHDFDDEDNGDREPPCTSKNLQLLLSKKLVVQRESARVKDSIR